MARGAHPPNNSQSASSSSAVIDSLKDLTKTVTSSSNAHEVEFSLPDGTVYHTKPLKDSLNNKFLVWIEKHDKFSITVFILIIIFSLWFGNFLSTQWKIELTQQELMNVLRKILLD